MSTKLYQKTSKVCCRLCCYKCAACVTMPMATNKQYITLGCSYRGNSDFTTSALTILGSQAPWENLFDEDPKVFFQIWGDISSSHNTDPQSLLATIDDNLLGMLPLPHCCGWDGTMRDKEAKSLTNLIRIICSPQCSLSMCKFTDHRLNHLRSGRS